MGDDEFEFEFELSLLLLLILLMFSWLLLIVIPKAKELLLEWNGLFDTPPLLLLGGKLQFLSQKVR